MDVDTGINRFGGRKLREFAFEGLYFLCEVGGNINYYKEEIVEKLKVPTDF